MGQNRVMEGRGAPFYVSDRLLEGVTSVTVPGASTQRFPIGDVLDRVRRYSTDIPEPGTASVSFNFNPGDILHKDLLKWLKDNTLLQFEWWTVGKKVNGIKTKTGVNRGKIDVLKLTKDSASGKGAYATIEVDKDSATLTQPAVGDYLKNSSNLELIVQNADYSTADKIKYYVKNKANSALTTSSTKTNYDITHPATQVIFNGQILGLPMTGGLVMTAQMAISITGEITYKVGNPDIT